MRLPDLLAALPQIVEHSEDDIVIEGVTDDSRKVRDGFLFVAIPGVNVDGHRFIPEALKAGAVAVVGEWPAAELDLPDAVFYIQVPDARSALGWLHAAWQAYPSREITLIGVTGTDGKTTTVNLLHAMLQFGELKTGMISTVNARVGEQSYNTGLHTTTPPAPAVQKYLAEMLQAGVTHAVLEATSEGLAQQRLVGCDFDVAVITNVTHEHLNYHVTWDAYRDAKAQLFRALARARVKPEQPKIAVLNRDDENTYAYLCNIPADWQVSYGIAREDADVTAWDVAFYPDGLSFTLRSSWGDGEIRSSLTGKYNVSNILAAASAALALGVKPEAVAASVAAFTGVPGRMERIDEGQAFTAVVDFAHTPNALREVLETARELVKGDQGRVIVAFGSAGLRDVAKRRLMGEVAGLGADLIVVTAEDPRTEPLETLMGDIAEGLVAQGRCEGVDFWRVPDRGEALRYAVGLAQPGDIVLACGKGHEQSMCFGTQEYPWDDREALRLALRGETLNTLPTAESGANLSA